MCFGCGSVSLIFKIADFPVLTFFQQLCQNLNIVGAVGIFLMQNTIWFVLIVYYFVFFSVVDYDLSKLLEKMNMLGWIGLPTPIFFDHALDYYIYYNKCIQFQL